jgi:hypothetical protein
LAKVNNCILQGDIQMGHFEPDPDPPDYAPDILVDISEDKVKTCSRKTA